MNTYIYAKSGHTVGLESVRRAAVVYKQLKSRGHSPILCTSDYRAAIFAKDLGVNKGVGIDVIENLPNIMERNDILIFDSDEPSDTMKKYMKKYCSYLYEIGLDIPKTIVDDDFFDNFEKIDKKYFFFGDDDYNNILLKICKNSNRQNISLLMGHYYFLGNDKLLEPYFENIANEDSYFDIISRTKYLLSASTHAVFESIACGNSPIFYQRFDKHNSDIELLKQHNIPIIKGDNLDDIVLNFNSIIKNYPKIKLINKTTIPSIEL